MKQLRRLKRKIATVTERWSEGILHRFDRVNGSPDRVGADVRDGPSVRRVLDGGVDEASGFRGSRRDHC